MSRVIKKPHNLHCHHTFSVYAMYAKDSIGVVECMLCRRMTVSVVCNPPNVRVTGICVECNLNIDCHIDVGKFFQIVHFCCETEHQRLVPIKRTYAEHEKVQCCSVTGNC